VQYTTDRWNAPFEHFNLIITFKPPHDYARPRWANHSATTLTSLITAAEHLKQFWTLSEPFEGQQCSEDPPQQNWISSERRLALGSYHRMGIAERREA
jgi:hypothetical protein